MKKVVYMGLIISLLLNNSVAQRNDTVYGGDIIFEYISERYDALNYHYYFGQSCYNSTYFFIYDLTDTTKAFRYDGIETDFVFLEKHIYHIGGLNTYCKISLIMIPYHGKLYFFEGLNCAEYIHTIEDVLYWIHDNFDEKLGNDELNRIINYQKYHKSRVIDPQGSKPKCEYGESKERENNKIKAPAVVNLKKTTE